MGKSSIKMRQSESAKLKDEKQNISEYQGKILLQLWNAYNTYFAFIEDQDKFLIHVVKYKKNT